MPNKGTMHKLKTICIESFTVIILVQIVWQSVINVN